MGGPSLCPLRPLLPSGEVAQIRASGPICLGLCPPASGRPDAPVPSLPGWASACLKFRISLPGEFSFVSPPPPPAVGDGGDLPWEEKSLFVPEGLCLHCPAQPPYTPTTTPHPPHPARRAAALGVGCSSDVRGEVCWEAGPGGSGKTSWSGGGWVLWGRWGELEPCLAPGGSPQAPGLLVGVGNNITRTSDRFWSPAWHSHFSGSLSSTAASEPPGFVAEET